MGGRGVRDASGNPLPQYFQSQPSVAASASGPDKGISPAYAAIRVRRVAADRGVPVADVEALVAEATHGRDLGVIAAPYVTVLDLDLALDRVFGTAG